MSHIDRLARPLLEVACFNGDSGVHAAEGGADRIELCYDYTSGGLSPDPAMLTRLKTQVSIPVFVMIRPRANDFFYNNEEFEIMKSTLMTLKNAGADGFVFGILNPVPLDNPACSWIDVNRNKQLVKLAGDKPCTFHRAFDCIPERHWGTALGNLAECGFASILTSGGPSGNTAIECVDKLAELFRQADLTQSQLLSDLRVPEIIVGGGVRSSNIRLLWERTHGRAFHSSALVDNSDVVAAAEVEKLKDSLIRFELQ
ncbi:copper homeostasis protein [Penicillium longicatenatum]|uniref:copper homeostasis protein n=1 Tax=Penicillium longicatenatum TaxID=1561947 RepID=UPI002548905B|nr:copper homeostasis protein [Penicillium longicatenatum]KAJ5657278.1 copper homeostasis protein [Penicillium longicatenatum]